MIFLMSCGPKTPTDLTRESIIPKPLSVAATGDYFCLGEKTDIYVQGESDELKNVAGYLADRLRPATGFPLEVKTTAEVPGKGNIFLTLSGVDATLGDEGYKLTITKKLITLAANKPAGLFNGTQTIRQLFPAEIEMSTKQEYDWQIATGTITDHPEYYYRGAMLDVTRHFFTVQEVMRFIDLISAYKINTLHLHLSDDQGWRIEIKSWPNLALYGGKTEVGGGVGGYYTQAEYAELVKYADDHFVTIIPEIDMPGHTNAALASYSELNISGKATELYTGTEVGFSTLATKKEITYKFIEDVFKELAELTTGPYLHIGGDESHVTKKEDYIPFVERVQDIVIKLGKTPIGWDEISLGKLRPGAIAQYWSSAENANKAVAQGAKLLMSPAARAYIDMKYDSTTRIGYTWAGLIEVDKAYNWDPATLEPGIGRENIIGIEAALWTETVTTIEEIEYMTFPRLPGLAEIGWTHSSLRNWDEYKVRLGNHGKRFKAMGINYYPSKLVPWVE
ncbi:MAG TPA: beta-N-acetylhexosaminidase [Bacteroidales bacterium]|nr:beta-N-acetylhexosaminidase [Bacteroidales bacterium]HBH84009.1 beta-N-acetylhexosaminidase [Bacteroidales bacterium]HBQ84418.1 beta-N-acetylhexosaminidase [Bacteroidales bacterium]HCU17745.1 beta-N-acetylhexosaminidase [Bacteroidales bacterium]